MLEKQSFSIVVLLSLSGCAAAAAKYWLKPQLGCCPAATPIVK